MPKYIEQMVSQQVRRSEVAKRREKENGFPCTNPVVTISRTMGSGARIIAEKLARELGWSLWDKELVNAMADHAHVSQKVVQAFDEHTISEIELFARGMFGDHEVAGFIYPRHLARAVKSIAKLGNAIILGRGANYILPDALRIRIDAPVEMRVRNMMIYEGLTHAAAEAKIHESDRERQHFLATVFGKQRTEDPKFEVTLWMENLSNDDAVQILLAAVKVWCAKNLSAPGGKEMT